jgi:hypothetical protein
MTRKPESEQHALATVEPNLPAPTTVYELIGQLARDPNVDPSRIAQLMDLQERAEARQAEREFTAAMNRVQQKLQDVKITKSGKIEFESKRTGTSQSTPYAKYENVWHVVGPILLGEGFSVSFGTQPLPEKGGIIISATLHHIAGHSQTESMPLPYDTSGSKNSIQAVGSSLSYGKRYLLFALVNLIAENEDDDGMAINFISEEQQQNIEALISECGLSAEGRSKFMDFLGVKAVGDIQKGGYHAAINFLVAKRRKIEERTQ